MTDRATDEVRSFDGGDWPEHEPAPTGAWPHAVRVLPSGEVVVATAMDGRLEIGRRSIPIGRTAETLDVRRDGAIAVAAATEGVVAVYADGRDFLGRWHVGGRPVRVLFSPDGSTLAVALSAAGAIALIDGEGTRTVEVSGVPDGLVFSRDGGVLYVSDVFAGALTVVDVASGDARVIAGIGRATGALHLVD